MHWQLYAFSCLHEVKECVWDFYCSGMLRCVTFQKSEDLIYSAAEAWKHANSKYLLLFYSACSWTYSSPFCLIFFWLFSPLFICLLSYQLAILSFPQIMMCESCNIPFVWEGINFLKHFAFICTVSAPFLFSGNHTCDFETRLWKWCLQLLKLYNSDSIYLHEIRCFLPLL